MDINTIYTLQKIRMKNIEINKGNYSLDTKERENSFSKNRAFNVEISYFGSLCH